MSGPIKHGLSRHPLVGTWGNMVQRCTNPKSPVYPHYGGRGIKIDPRWRSLELFILDVGTKPPGSTLDRIDNDKDYGPTNFRWASRSEQQRNTRRARKTSGELLECTKCRQMLPHSSFTKASDSPYGKYNFCKACCKRSKK